MYGWESDKMSSHREQASSVMRSGPFWRTRSAMQVTATNAADSPKGDSRHSLINLLDRVLAQISTHRRNNLNPQRVRSIPEYSHAHSTSTHGRPRCKEAPPGPHQTRRPGKQDLRRLQQSKSSMGLRYPPHLTRTLHPSSLQSASPSSSASNAPACTEVSACTSGISLSPSIT